MQGPQSLKSIIDGDFDHREEYNIAPRLSRKQSQNQRREPMVEGKSYEHVTRMDDKG